MCDIHDMRELGLHLRDFEVNKYKQFDIADICLVQVHLFDSSYIMYNNMISNHTPQ